MRRESERAEERLCKVNGSILGSRELVSGAGQSLREMRETYCLKVCDSEGAGKYYGRTRKVAENCMQRRHECFAEEVERILVGEMLRKPKSSMRRKGF